ncbi:class IV adenylate cyclase [Streptomyces sp. 891-h]|uniref:class IV adenylate cyclase n=1 Tax=Streptomyces sp. 891-h TaxID=2720714 RepID=UPI001FA9D205|nr:class IV adenylate cyclase [Streptomyces sp. 891-h]UNZ18242.1 class IV adenylate cyclase [Streptomyces sp. 891-h]
MIEAELKARVRDPNAVKQRLDEYAVGRAEVYRDTYYDTSEGQLGARDAELRVRTVRSETETRSLLTYKEAKVDEASGSKPEHETRVENAEAVHRMLQGLGYEPVIAFEKRCRNYDVQARGRLMLATLVQVPEIDGTFIELETLVQDEADVQAALADVRAVLESLGIEDADLTRELYTDAVLARRTTGTRTDE